MVNAKVNLVRNAITNYFADMSEIRDKRKDVQNAHDIAMNELAVKETVLMKTLARDSK